MSLDVFKRVDPELKRRQDVDASLDAFTRLLAAENIVVVRGKFQTASFDIKNRVCQIPDWKDMSHSLQVLFRAHEMGHALYTTQENFHEWVETKPDQRMFSYFNIIEDVRIERNIQSQFPGLTRSFNSAYTELMARNFFGDIVDRDMIFIDRININTKLGETRYPMTFKNDTERELYARLQFLRSFDDAMQLAQDIFDYAVNDEPELDNEDQEEGQGEGDGQPETYMDQFDFDGDDGSSDEQGESNQEGETEYGDEPDYDGSDEQTQSKGESVTDNMFRQAEESVLEDSAPEADRYASTDPVILEMSSAESSRDINFKKHSTSKMFTFLNAL